MKNRGRLAAVGISLGALAIAAAAPAQPIDLDHLVGLEEGDAIVVTAKPDPEPQHDEVRKQVRSITRNVDIFSEPLARFESKMCPGVLGLPLDVAELVVGRLRYNAERVGLRLATESECRPNFIVGFVGSGRADLQRMLDKNGSMLTQIPLAERRELLNDTGPVHAFAITTERSRDGMRVLGDTKYGQTPTLNTQSSNSLIVLSNRVDIEQSVVLIDIAAIDGFTVNQLADYATMRGLAQTKAVEGDASYGTILNLFDPEASHHYELTNFDLAYLNMLYGSIANLPAAAKLGRVKGLMNEQIAQAEREQQE